MRIVIIGNGKVGSTFARQLAMSGHDVTIVDRRQSALQACADLDLMSIEGNGASYDVLQDAGVDKTDLLIAATGKQMHACLMCEQLSLKNIEEFL